MEALSSTFDNTENNFLTARRDSSSPPRYFSHPISCITVKYGCFVRPRLQRNPVPHPHPTATSLPSSSFAADIKSPTTTSPHPPQTRTMKRDTAPPPLRPQQPLDGPNDITTIPALSLPNSIHHPSHPEITYATHTTPTLAELTAAASPANTNDDTITSSRQPIPPVPASAEVSTGYPTPTPSATAPTSPVIFFAEHDDPTEFTTPTRSPLKLTNCRPLSPPRLLPDPDTDLSMPSLVLPRTRAVDVPHFAHITDGLRYLGRTHWH